MTSFKQQILDIQHKLNASYSGTDERNIIRLLNRINSDLFEIVALWDKEDPYEFIYENLKMERENTHPMETTEMEILDTLISELECVFFAEKK